MATEKTLSNSSTHSLGMLSPVYWGALGAMLVGAALLLLSYWLLAEGSTPKTLDIATLVLAIVEVCVGFFTIKGARVAWSFAISVNGTAAAVLLFSAPRIRDAAQVSILLALVPCTVFVVLVTLLSLKSE